MSLTVEQKRVARLLALGRTQRATARQVGVDPRTIRRWLTGNPTFVEFIEKQRESVSSEDEVTTALYDLLYDPSPNIRIQAARELRRGNTSAPPSGVDDADILSTWK